MEIEKKFQVKYLPENLEQYEKKEIEQAYLCANPTLRIRKSNDSYIFTMKSKEGVKKEWEETMIVSQEIEVALSKEAYEHLKKKTDGNPIKKTRYEIPLENGLTAELDIFKGKLTGLCFVEVEFQSRKQAEEFCLPDWFGKDVSADRRYRNTYLSTLEYFESGFLD